MTTNTEFQGYRGRGLPGSVHCRLNFEIDSSAFANVKVSSRTRKRKDEISKFKKRHQLGDKPGWNNSVEKQWVKPIKMRQLSKYQSIKIPYDYRDSEVSKVYKNQIFIPKSGKYEIDPYPFLDDEQKRRATRQNILVNRERAKETDKLKKTQRITADFNGSTYFTDQDVHKGYEEQRSKTMRITKRKTTKILKGKKVNRVSLMDQYKKKRAIQRKKKIEQRRFDDLQNSIRGKKKDREKARFVTRV